MIGLFKRAAPAAAALGVTTLAQRMPSLALVPQGCIGVVFDKGGATRRIGQGARIKLHAHEGAFCFHPGPYAVDLTPFAAAPELGLRLDFAVDAPDPRVAQQRFDLYLASEGGESVQLGAFGAAIDSALQRELAQGNLELPPCTSLDEWNLFRAGLNQLLYQRFGVTVEDCVPVELDVDYALLLRREPAAQPEAAAIHARPALSDAQALRRLFLELPRVTSAVRLIDMSPFRQQQELLQRLDRVTLLIDTMPSLALAAPGKPLAGAHQELRTQHSNAAVAALDEAWALLARPFLFDDADRIVANLEHHCAGRRATA
jgi:hypothetical protein